MRSRETEKKTGREHESESVREEVKKGENSVTFRERAACDASLRSMPKSSRYFILIPTFV